MKSRCPFVPTTWKLLNDLSKLGIRAAQWTNYRWSADYLNAHLYSMFSFPGPVLGHREWACPEHLRLSSIACGLAFGVFTRLYTNGVSLPCRIASVMPPIKSQTTLSQRAPYIGHLKVAGLTVLDDDTRCWLNTTTPST